MVNLTKFDLMRLPMFAEGSANVSVTTFLSGLQKRPKIGRPRDIRI